MKAMLSTILVALTFGCESGPTPTPQDSPDASQESDVRTSTLSVTAIEVVESNGSLPPQYQRTTRTNLSRSQTPDFDTKVNDVLDHTRVNGKATLREYVVATLDQNGKRLMEIKGMVARPAPTGGGSVDIYLHFEDGRSFVIEEHGVEYDRDFEVLLELARKHGTSKTTSYGDPIVEPSLRAPDSDL